MESILITSSVSLRSAPSHKGEGWKKNLLDNFFSTIRSLLRSFFSTAKGMNASAAKGIAAEILLLLGNVRDIDGDCFVVPPRNDDQGSAAKDWSGKPGDPPP